jgi:hypothetical protein
VILAEDSGLHNVHVALPGGLIEDDALEPPGLLRVTLAISVVARERLEGADLVPSGTEVRGGVRSTETANVSTNKGNAEHVHLHDADNTLLEVDNISVVISKPLRSILTHAGKRAT